MTDNHELSPREREILTLVAQGLTNREIAQELSISPNTVKVHVSNIFSKAGVASRTEATLYGMEQGIVDVPGGGEGSEPGRPDWRSLARQFRWVWIAMLGLLVLILVALSTNLIFPPPAPAPTPGPELAERWQELAPMPEPLRGMAAAAYDGDIFTLGGEGPQGLSHLVYRYDFENVRWETREEKPTAVTDVQGVSIGEKIYVPGGRLADGSPTDVLEIYNPRTDEWETGAPLPAAVSGYALADFDGQVYLFGGWDGSGEASQVWIYDPTADVWQQGQPMGRPRAYARAVALEDRIVLMGGQRAGEALSESLVYYPSRDTAGEDPWEDFIDLPVPLYDFGAASVYDKIYVIGGFSTGGMISDENRPQTSGWVLAEEEWVALPTEENYAGRETALVSLGSLLAVLDSAKSLTATNFSTYQAFYFSIYIPFIP